MIPFGIHATALLLWGIVVHLFCDWPLQNRWMAWNKRSLKHPAAYVHGGIHLAGLLLVFPWYASILIAFTHVLIDTRAPLAWWNDVFHRDGGGSTPTDIVVAMWTDQVAHITVLAVAALLIGGLQ